MEEFKNFCAGMKGAPEIITKIDDLMYKAIGGGDYTGVDCLQNMADDITKLSE